MTSWKVEHMAVKRRVYIKISTWLPFVKRYQIGSKYTFRLAAIWLIFQHMLIESELKVSHCLNRLDSSLPKKKVIASQRPQEKLHHNCEQNWTFNLISFLLKKNKYTKQNSFILRLFLSFPWCVAYRVLHNNKNSVEEKKIKETETDDEVYTDLHPTFE